MRERSAMPERTAGGLFLPGAEALALPDAVAPPFARPMEPAGAGFVIDSGFASGYFVTDPEKWIAELEEPLALIVNRAIEETSELIPILELVARDGRPLFIVAPGLALEPLALLVVNKLRGILLHVDAIETKRIVDVAQVLGSKIHDSANVTIADLVTAKRVASGARTTLVVK